MARIIHWLVPKEEKFFDLLEKQAENVLEGAKELKSYVHEYSKLDKSERKSRSSSIKGIEGKGDELTHDIMEKLDVAFITPIDKEDIHRLAVLLDDVIDLINGVSLRFVMLGIERIDEYIEKFVDIIHHAVIEVHKSVIDLRKLDNMKDHYVRIHSLENEADDLYCDAISDLFHYYKNSIDIIKYKELYELLEKITDKCEDLAHIMESVVVKHA